MVDLAPNLARIGLFRLLGSGQATAHCRRCRSFVWRCRND